MFSLTASRITLARLCAWWTRPEIWLDGNEPVTPEQQRGTNAHESIDRRDKSNPLALDAIGFLESIDPSAKIYQEQPLAMDMLTGKARLLEKAGHREYGALLNGEVAGTADVLIVYPDWIHVIDWKTGRGSTPAENNDQLKFLAFAAMSVFGVSRAKISLGMVAEDAWVLWDNADLLLWERGEWLESLRNLPMERPFPGAHCKYCPALRACPGIKRAIEELEELIMPTSHEHAVKIHRRLGAIKAATTRAQNALAAWIASNGPIALPDGTQYGFSETTREKITAQPQVVEYILTQIGSEALEYDVSKASLERALRAKGERPAALRKHLDVIRSMGGIELKTSRVLGELKNEHRCSTR